MLNRLENYILSNWKTYGMSLDKPGRLFFLLMKRGKKKIWFLIFRENDRKPFLFAKTTRFAIDDYVLKRELENFSGFKTVIGNEGNFLVPDVFDCIDIKGHTAYVSNFIEGRKLDTNLKHFPDNLTFVAEHIINMGRITEKNVDSFEKENNFLVSMIKDEVNVFLNYKQLSHSEQDDLRAGIEKIFDYDELEKKLTKTVFEHVDVGINNIMVTDNGKFFLFDWEYSKGYGIPLYDLLFFVFHYFWYYQSDHAAKYTKKTDTHGILSCCFFEINQYSDLILEQLYRYCDAIECDIKLYPEILLYIFIRLENFSRKKIWHEEEGTFSILVRDLIENYSLFRF